MHAHHPPLFGIAIGGAIVLLTIMSPLAVIAQGVGAPLVITLENALKIALQQNWAVQIADQDRLKADAQVAEARSGALPTLNVTAVYTRNIKNPVMFLPPNSVINPTPRTQALEFGSANAYQAGATISQALFNRRVGTALDIANMYAQYEESAYQTTRQEVALQTKKAFYAALLARELLRANREGLDAVQANFKNVQAQYDKGTVAEFDLLRAEVQVANTEPLFIAAENNLKLAKNTLKNILTISLDREIDVQGDLTYIGIEPNVVEQRRRDALVTNPVIVQLKLRESILEKNITIEQANYFPTLNLVGSYQWQSQDNSYNFNNYLWANSFNVGLQLAYPLFDGFKTSARTEQATIEHQQSLATLHKAEEALRLRINSLELRMAEATKRIEGQEKSLGQAQKALKIAETRFKSGVGTQLEIMDTQVAMTLTQTNYAQAIYDYLVARAEWETAVGQPQ